MINNARNYAMHKLGGAQLLSDCIFYTTVGNYSLLFFKENLTLVIY